MVTYKKRTGLNDNERYPYVVNYPFGHINIPQQKKFGTYCSHHGCSVTAVSIATQFAGCKQSDKTVWNPKEVYEFAKKRVSGYNGSKLSIFGCHKAINRIAGKTVAEWHSSTKTNKAHMEKKIRDALKSGHIVLFEEKNPIHTVVLLGMTDSSHVLVATNGKVVKRSMKTQMNYRLCGKSGKDNQKNWWNGSTHGAGYVIVKR